MADRPNILLIVSDEERRNDWLDGVVDLPARQRLRADGLSFDRYFTHASPCSPSRASLYTGRYLAEHGVVDNVAFPTHAALDPAIPTIGSLLAERGYLSSYLGKWHLSHGDTPDMAAHGYLDWAGNDVHFMGSAYTGRYFDPIIVDQAIGWLHDRAGSNGAGGNSDTSAGGQPWFLTVALVNPHDIMWFPADHRSYQAAHPKFAQFLAAVQQMRLGDLPVTPPPEDYPRLFDRLPENFGDDLHTKPEVQRAWRHVRNREHLVGRIDADDHDTWLRGLDYYAWLHARYYGVGGGTRRDGTADGQGKIFDVDADFDDHDHEWYETAADPHELANLANDRGRRNELRALFRRLLDYEAQELTLTP